jgi:hypothetical protein
MMEDFKDMIDAVTFDEVKYKDEFYIVVVNHKNEFWILQSNLNDKLFFVSERKGLVSISKVQEHIRQLIDTRTIKEKAFLA